MWGRWYSGAGDEGRGLATERGSGVEGSAACYRQLVSGPFWLVPSASITKIS